QNPLVKQMTNLLKGFQIVLEIDSSGSIEGVRNWKELKKRSAKLLDTMTEELQKGGVAKAMVARACAQVASMFATKEQIEQMSTRDAQLFFLILGRAYPPSKALEYEDKLQNPLGGEPFPSRAVFSLKAIDKKSGRAVVTWKQTVDPKEAGRV